MWGYESDEQFYEYAIAKVLEHKNMIDKKENYIFRKKPQQISEARKRVINKILNNEKIDDKDYNLMMNNTEVYNLKFKKVRRSIL